MKIAIQAIMILLALPSSVSAEPERKCQEGHRTMLKIVDCDYEPVQDVDVSITLCCDEPLKAGATNEKGEVIFPYFHEQICARAIFGHEVRGQVNCLESPSKLGGKTFCRITVRVCN